jgi:hypothetical protein
MNNIRKIHAEGYIFILLEPSVTLEYLFGR